MTSTHTRHWCVVLVVLLLLGGCTSSDTAQPIDEDLAAPRAPFTVEYSVSSPDGSLRMELGIDELDRARYRVIRTIEGTDTPVVNDSTFGLETSIGSFTRPATIEPLGEIQPATSSVSLPHGKARESDISANVQTFALGAGPDGLAVDVWVSDTAAAFRYVLAAPGETFTVRWERTSFALPPESRSWLQRHDPPSYATPAYEALRSRETAVENIGRSAFGWTFPALFASGDNWTLVTETALASGAAGSHISPAVTDGEFLLDFADWGEGNGVGSPQPVATDTWTSPWRLIVTSTDIGDIVESTHVQHLSPAADESVDYSWVEPGRVSWSWWSDHNSSRDAEAIKPFVDLADQLGWEYSLVDANWNEFEDDDDLEELIAYAAERGVGLFLWYNSGGAHNAVTEAPRDIMSDAEPRRAEMARIAALGIRGIKVDFFQSDKPVTIQLYRDILTDAAEAGLMVNFHGSTLPRGWEREFPHLMTMEAVRGGEIYTFNFNYQRVAARQNTVLPFTRNVVGSMDYTPTILGDSTRRRTTNGHELALAVVFESALQHLIDTPEAYLGQPAEVIDLLATVPTVWDQTEYLEGLPESHIVIARRLGSQWWIGAINGDLEEEVSRDVSIDLGELGIAPGTEQLVVCDNPSWEGTDTISDASQYRISNNPSTDTLRLELVPSGGCLIRIAG